MDLTQTLSSLLGLAVGSGLNLYAAVLVCGLALRLEWLIGVPQELMIAANPWVMGVAAVLYAAEFIADKVPGFTPFWDAIHTFIRPVGGALLAFGAAGNLPPVVKVIAMLVGGSVALGVHSTKMSARLAAHAVPEPVTHSLISLAEDFGVVGLLVLVFKAPWIALGIIGVILLAMAILLPLLIRKVLQALRKLSSVFESPSAQSPG
jgi:hypothetical protein